jgi:DNA-binding MarR family transcriptional regulator
MRAMTTTATDPIDTTELASRLRLSVTRLARRLRQEAETGITPSQLAALATVERHQPLTAGELSAHEQVQPPTMTKVVSALVEGGLVARQTDPEDRRVTWFRLTAEGARFLARARRRKEEYLARRLRRVAPSELVTLLEAVAVLERLVEGEPR